MRVGIGQDSHVFEKNKPLILGGVVIPEHSGLKANSDGDVILHSICNAIGSAIGKGSISTYADKMCQNGTTDSSKYLQYIYNIALNKGLKINNIAISVECKTPKLEKHSKKICNKIAQILETDTYNIGLTITSGEGLTEFGKGKGIQAISIVSLIKNE